MITSLALLLLGFVLLIKGADLLVGGAVSIARRYDVSDLVIGLTVVAFGTSAPELFVNIIASLQGRTGLAIGNVLGSNIANVLLILGVTAAIHPLRVSRATVWREIPFCLLAAVVLGFLANDRLLDGAEASVLTRSDGLVLLSFFSIFMYYSFLTARRGEPAAVDAPGAVRGLALSLAMTAAGLAGLALGGKWIVDGAVRIGTALGASDSLMGLTVVAVGTSLPELATSTVAAWRKNADIAVGNVVGSNIFNVFFVLGVSSTVRPLPFQTAGNLDIGLVILSSLLLFLTTVVRGRHRIERGEGVAFLVTYAAYMAYLFLRG